MKPNTPTKVCEVYAPSDGLQEPYIPKYNIGALSSSKDKSKGSVLKVTEWTKYCSIVFLVGVLGAFVYDYLMMNKLKSSNKKELELHKNTRHNTIHSTNKKTILGKVRSKRMYNFAIGFISGCSLSYIGILLYREFKYYYSNFQSET